MTALPRKVQVLHDGHLIEGNIEFGASETRGSKVQYTMTLTEGYLVCGPHDAEGNHIQREAAA